MTNEQRTKRAIIISKLRELWLRSKERANALKRDNYTCVHCHRKASKAKDNVFKVQVHHKHGIVNWDKLETEIRANLLCDIEHLETLCKECHVEEERRIKGQE